MKTPSFTFLKSRAVFGIVLLSLCILSIDSYAKGDQIYQLKVYTIENEKQELRMDKYLEQAFIPALHRAGIEHVGVFKPVKDDPSHGTSIYVVIPFSNIVQFEKLERVISKDSNYQKAGADYIHASHDDPPYTRIGISDGGILDATLVVAYFNYVNRIVLALGLEVSDAEMKGYKY